MSLRRFEHGAVCAELNETALVAAQRMRDHHVGCVVITRGAHPVGILTDRDLAVRLVAENKNAAKTLVSEIVTYDATTLSRDANIDTAARTMREKGVRRLPIVTDDGRVTGIVTADDLVTLLTRELADLGESIEQRVDATESR